MVSLSDESRRLGGYFFDEDSSVQVSDSNNLLQNEEIFAADRELPFRQIKTTWAILLELFLFVVLEAAVFVVPAVCEGRRCGTDAVSILLYSHAGLWFLLMLFDFYLHKQHHISRLLGYLDFFRKTKSIRRVPLLINSGACAFLLIIMQVLDRYCEQEQRCHKFKAQNYLQVIVSLEVAATLPFLFLYLVRTIRFNKEEACPDVNQDEMLTSFIQSQSQTSDIGFRDENYVDQILEKQADMIRYLKQHNAQLGKRILALTAEKTLRREQQ